MCAPFQVTCMERPFRLLLYQQFLIKSRRVSSGSPHGLKILYLFEPRSQIVVLIFSNLTSHVHNTLPKVIFCLNLILKLELGVGTTRLIHPKVLRENLFMALSPKIYKSNSVEEFSSFLSRG